jgi:hypothetical protein
MHKTRRQLRKVAICVAVPALVVAVGLAVTATGHQRAATITLHATSQLQKVHVVDNPPAGHSAGDTLVFTEKLLDDRGGVVGHDAASCTSLFNQRSLCTGDYFLRSPRGQVMVQLRQPGLGNLTYTQAIVGGTGHYAGATGSVTVDQQPSGDRFTFHIHLPG